MDLPPDVQRWCMALQPQFKSHNTNEVPKLLQTVSGEEPPFGDRRQCGRWPRWGTVARLEEHSFILGMNQRQLWALSRCWQPNHHHLTYPARARNLPSDVSFVLVPSEPGPCRNRQRSAHGQSLPPCP